MESLREVRDILSKTNIKGQDLIDILGYINYLEEVKTDYELLKDKINGLYAFMNTLF